MSRTIYTIGHSTRTLKEFIAILQAYDITYLVDVRTIPKSRHNPQFNSKRLETALKKAKIHYYHAAELGGLRHTTKDSINKAWLNASFRGYADYMQTKEFSDGLKVLMRIARKYKTVIMCAESVPWRCHRSLIGDALLVRTFTVMDIYSATNAKEHTLTPWAHVKGKVITYP